MKKYAKTGMNLYFLQIQKKKEIKAKNKEIDKNQFMKRSFLIIFFILFFIGSSKEIAAGNKLDKCYWITYGNPKAPVYALEYFSFRCPHCIHFIKKEFPSIKREMIENHKIFWIFHPFPIDLLTIQAMVCLQELNTKEKDLFFKLIFSKIDNHSPKTLIRIMKQEMKRFHKKELPIESIDFLKKTKAFENAFEFMTHTSVHHVPTLEVDGVIYHHQTNKKFLEKIIKQKK